jgi:hypothetical protein
MTLWPWAWSCSITALQLEPSAHAPWMNTTLVCDLFGSILNFFLFELLDRSA